MSCDTGAQEEKGLFPMTCTFDWAKWSSCVLAEAVLILKIVEMLFCGVKRCECVCLLGRCESRLIAALLCLSATLSST